MPMRYWKSWASPVPLSFQDSAGNVVLEGTDVSDAQAGYQTNSLGNQEPVVQLTLTENGKIKFAEATKKAAPTRDIIYIIYDGSVVSAPAVQSEITDGSAVITGMGSFEEAETLASTIRIGGLKLQLEELRSNVVGAQLGSEAINRSLYGRRNRYGYCHGVHDCRLLDPRCGELIGAVYVCSADDPAAQRL